MEEERRIIGSVRGHITLRVFLNKERKGFGLDEKMYLSSNIGTKID